MAGPAFHDSGGKLYLCDYGLRLTHRMAGDALKMILFLELLLVLKPLLERVGFFEIARVLFV